MTLFDVLAHKVVMYMRQLALLEIRYTSMVHVLHYTIELAWCMYIGEILKCVSSVTFTPVHIHLYIYRYRAGLHWKLSLCFSSDVYTRCTG